MKKALEALGVNVTRLEWRLREREIRRERALAEAAEAEQAGSGRRGFQHKICGDCGRIIDRDAAVCDHCGAAAPSVGTWRARRAVSMIIPAGALIVTSAFMALIIGNFIVGFVVDRQGLFGSPGLKTLADLGAYLPRHPMYDQWWRLFSFALVHGGLLHLFFNASALAQLGPELEQEIGWQRLLVVITITQLSAALVAMYTGQPVVGASGWIFGLIGFGFVYNKRLGRKELASKFLNWVIGGFVFGLIMTRMAGMGIHHGAHAGGAIGGAVAALIFPLRLGREDMAARFWNALVFPCAAVWLYAIVKIVASIIRNFL